MKSSRLFVGFVLTTICLSVVLFLWSLLTPVTQEVISNTAVSPEEILVRIKTKKGNDVNRISKTGAGTQKVPLWQHSGTNLPVPTLENIAWRYPDLYCTNLPPDYEAELLRRYDDDWRVAVTAFYASLGREPDEYDLIPFYPPRISERLSARRAVEMEAQMREYEMWKNQWATQARLRVAAMTNIPPDIQRELDADKEHRARR